MIIESASRFIGKHMGVVVSIVAATALAVPASSLWIQLSWINWLLAVVMFGMGATLKPSDFTPLLRRPQDVALGCVAQFTVMPLLAYLLGKAFGLETGLLVGVVLVGACPGGTASNVIAYLSKGDVALSVAMTSVNTLLAPLMTPMLTWLMLRASITVDVATIFTSILVVVILPISLGFAFNRFFGKSSEKLAGSLPGVSVIAISLIVASIVSHNARQIYQTGAIVFVVVALHNLLGFLFGWLVGSALKLPTSKKKTLTIEIGMQNSGLAASLAGAAFPNYAMAATPGAIFSVWHNISGSILANIFRRLSDKQE